MSPLQNLSTHQLKRAIEIKTEIERLETELQSISGTPPPSGTGKTRRKMSAAGRARIGAAAKARWAKLRAAKAEPVKKKRKMSAAVKARLSAIAKERWKNAKAAGKPKL